MKIRMTFTLDVDEEAWAAEYGAEPAGVRKDVKSYVTTLLNDCRAGDAGLWKDISMSERSD